jgi:hypothetical protein
MFPARFSLSLPRFCAMSLKFMWPGSGCSTMWYPAPVTKSSESCRPFLSSLLLLKPPHTWLFVAWLLPSSAGWDLFSPPRSLSVLFYSQELFVSGPRSSFSAPRHKVWKACGIERTMTVSVGVGARGLGASALTRRWAKQIASFQIRSSCFVSTAALWCPSVESTLIWNTFTTAVTPEPCADTWLDMDGRLSCLASLWWDQIVTLPTLRTEGPQDPSGCGGVCFFVGSGISIPAFSCMHKTLPVSPTFLRDCFLPEQTCSYPLSLSSE